MLRFIRFSVIAFLSCGIVHAQNSGVRADDFGRIVLTSYLDAGKVPIPKNAFNILRNRLTQISTQNGIGGSITQRFIITANVNVLTKNITPTVPAMIALTVETTFYVGDGVDGTLFSTASTVSKGVGETEDKAFIAALKSIRPSSPEFGQLIETGKRKITEYYNANGDMYISKAKALAKEERFDEAIYMLMCIPAVCKDIYSEAMDEVSVIYTAKINTLSAKKLSEARAVWSSGYDYDSAASAAELLADVHPDAACYQSAVALSEEIAKRVKELDERDWQFILQEQNNVHMEQMAQIQASRDIAVAWAENQPETVYKVVWW